MLQIPNNYVVVVSVYPENGVPIDSKYTSMSGNYKLNVKEDDPDFGVDVNIGGDRVWKITVAPKSGITGDGVCFVSGTQNKGQVAVGNLDLPIQVLAADTVPTPMPPITQNGLILLVDAYTKRP